MGFHTGLFEGFRYRYLVMAAPGRPNPAGGPPIPGSQYLPIPFPERLEPHPLSDWLPGATPFPSGFLRQNNVYSEVLPNKMIMVRAEDGEGPT